MSRPITENSDDHDDRYILDLELDKGLAREHLYLLSGCDDRDTTFTFFAIDDRKKEPKDPNKKEPGYDYRDRDREHGPPPQSWCDTLDESWPRIERLNRTGAGIFVCIHQMDDSGKRDTDNFLAVQTCVNDLDHGEPPKAYPIPPSFSIRSSKCGRHDYFLVKGTMSPEEYRAVQGGFIERYGGDKQVKDVTRVMRLAGSYHRKTYEPWLVTIDGPDGVSSYTAAVLLDAFRPPARADDKPTQSTAIAQLYPPEDTGPDEVRSILKALPAEWWEGRDNWVVAGQALHHWGCSSEEAFKIWCEYANVSDKFDEKDAGKVWHSFSAKGSTGKPITLRSLVMIAKEHGWVRPTKEIPVTAPNGAVQKYTEWPAKSGRDNKPASDSLPNVVFFLQQNGINPWFNEFDGKYYLDKGNYSEELTEYTLRDLRMRMHAKECKVKTELLDEGLKWYADRNKQHPLRTYLSDLEWDGVPRISEWLTTYVGVKNTEYSRAAGRAWLIMGVRRIREPGCQARAMLVLEGPQNVGKSTVLRTLAGAPYFTDSLPLGADPKQVIEEMAGKWIGECPDLERRTRREVGEIRAFISRRTDTARPAWGRIAKSVDRQFILGGTANAARYLTDKDGNTRFWPVKVGEIDIGALEEDRDHLWAEAAHYEAAGEPHWFDRRLEELAAGETAEREVNTPMEDRLLELLSNAPLGFVPSEELWSAVGLEDAGRREQKHNDSLGIATRKAGWSATRRRKGDGRIPGYLAPGIELVQADWLKYHKDRKTMVVK